MKDGKGYTILEPGAGPGIFSRLILSPPNGYPTFPLDKFVAIEPSNGMRSAWDKGFEKVSSSVKGLGGGPERVDCVDGSFEDLGMANVDKQSVDLVVVAQAWHWCPDFEKALVG